MRGFFCGVVAGILGLVSSTAIAAVSAGVRPGHPLYDLFDELDSYGCLQPYMRAIQPQNYLDLRAAIFLPNGEACEAPEAVLQKTRILSGTQLRNPARFSLLTIQANRIALPGIEASVTPLFPLREGRETNNGANLNAELEMAAGSGSTFGYAVGLTPGLLGTLVEYRSPALRFYLQEWFLSAGYKKFYLRFGKVLRSFGEAKYGTLIFSQASKPLTAFELGFSPFKIGSLGLLQFQTWIASQGESLSVSRARLWATSISAKPARWLEIAFLQLLQFGGQGAPELEASDYLKMFFNLDSANLDTKRSKRFALNFNVWGPDQIAKLYAQLFFPSITSDFFSRDLSFLLGFWFPRIGIGDLRLEYVRTNTGAYSDLFWKQGLSFRGTPLGHPLGNDGEGLYVDLALPSIEGFAPSLLLFYESRLKSNADLSLATEWRYGGGIGIDKRWTQAEVSLRLRYANVRNAGFQRDRLDDIAAAKLQVVLPF